MFVIFPLLSLTYVPHGLSGDSRAIIHLNRFETVNIECDEPIRSIGD